LTQDNIQGHSRYRITLFKFASEESRPCLIFEHNIEKIRMSHYLEEIERDEGEGVKFYRPNSSKSIGKNLPLVYIPGPNLR